MTLFPGERPEYPDGKPEGRRMEIRLHEGGRMTTASCLYCDGEGCFHGRAAVQNTHLNGRIHTDSLCQQIVKLAIYRAVLRSGRKKPVWGALTGVRPGKLMSPMLERGVPESEALRRFETEYDVSHDRALLCLDTSRATVLADRRLKPGDVCLYVGIPFCPTRCAYCSFVSQSVEKSMKQIPDFLGALEQELHAVAEQVRESGLHVVSIYMGGGTPTTLNEDQLDRLLTKIETEFDLSALKECTVEAGRPDTITEGKLRTLRKHGVDRVSVNPQTMSDAVLEAIGRKHSARPPDGGHGPGAEAGEHHHSHPQYQTRSETPLRRRDTALRRNGGINAGLCKRPAPGSGIQPVLSVPPEEHVRRLREYRMDPAGL